MPRPKQPSTPTYEVRQIDSSDFSGSDSEDHASALVTPIPRHDPGHLPTVRRSKKERRTSSGDSTASFMSVSSSPGYRLRPVTLSDEELVSLAHETKRKVNWASILRSTDGGSARWRWQEYIGDFSIFVREDTHKYAVLAIGVVPGNVAEVVSVMHASDNEQYLRKMEALYGDEFRDGCFVYNADVESEENQEASRNTADPDDGSQLVGLSVKTATFNKPSWFSKHEEWCYLDSVYQHPTTAEQGSTRGNDTFEKLMTSLRPQDIIVGLSPGHTKYIKSVVSGYLLKPEVDAEKANEGDNASPKCTRVHFYAELSKTTNQHHFGGLYLPSFGATATDNSVKVRLLKMARSSARLPLIVRRRRLGVQNIVDLRKVFPPTNTRCVHCDKFLLLAKMCRLCGQGVCQSCSRKHYRETQDTGSYRVHIQHIRVCDTCIARVDRTNYSYLTHTSLAAPRIRRDPDGAKRASAVLRCLLQEAYRSADSPDKKSSVLSVMQCVIDQEARHSTPFSSIRGPSSPGAVVTLGITDRDFLNALEYVCVGDEEIEEPELAHTDGRSYAIDPRNPMKPMSYPLPQNEEQRLRAIESEHLRELGNIPELNIVCELAAQELGCFATMVTVVDEDVQLILGANLPTLRDARFPRADTFCSHIIMDTKPLIVPHPEADIRFGQCGPVHNFGARYYCGFPLLAADGTVLGSLCCVDTKTHGLTTSQYVSLQKLSQTATKIVRNATRQYERRKLYEELMQEGGCAPAKHLHTSSVSVAKNS